MSVFFFARLTSFRAVNPADRYSSGVCGARAGLEIMNRTVLKGPTPQQSVTSFLFNSCIKCKEAIYIFLFAQRCSSYTSGRHFCNYDTVESRWCCL